ncbi:MAG TPA: GNAT family N-acetyltransferase [Gemmatimonadaceae bacterium]|nr:GNAT family N-acetyltransferase [Gemmatimonadaceae bacterium]
MTAHVSVERVDRLSDSLAALAVRVPFRAHQWLRPDAQHLLTGLTRHRMAQAIGTHGSEAWSAGGSTRADALVVLRQLAWDSEVLGVSAARIEIFAAGSYTERRHAIDAALEAALASAGAAGVRHVSVRVDAADDAAVHALEHRRFLNVDALMTFGRDLRGPFEPVVPGARVRPAAEDDAAAVGEIAREAFTEGRFHSDPDISRDTARDVYHRWALACCRGAAADAVLVAEDPGGVIGFIACRMQQDTAVHLQRSSGTIVLVAAAPAARGHGVGARLVQASTEWFSGQTASAIEVGTQLRNTRAANLYGRCGFRLVASALSFRATIE